MSRKPTQKPTSVSADVEKIRRKLGHLTLRWNPKHFLNTGREDLNQVLGHREKGIPYGRIMEISGLESSGKTALALNIAALAQQDEALVIWLDFESSFTAEWATIRGLDPERVALIERKVMKFDDEKRVITSEEMFEEAKAIVEDLSSKYGKMLVVVDSIASILPEGEAEAGLANRSFNVKMELPSFMSALLREWIGRAEARNCLMIFVNQLRQNPMAFGDPWYTPGGNSARFYSHIRLRLKRAGSKSGRLTQGSRQTGIKGIITNKKNKVGGIENSEIGYRLLFSGPMEFVPAKEIKRKEP